MAGSQKRCRKLQEARGLNVINELFVFVPLSKTLFSNELLV